MARKTTPETALKKQIRDYLRWNGWFVFPILQGLGAYPGISDMIALKNRQVLFIEAKRPNGRQSEKQAEFERNVTEKGGQYIIVKSLDDLYGAIGGVRQEKLF